MAKKREYLVTQYDRSLEVIRELRVPKSVNPKVLLERLICQGLDDDTIVASCLTRRAKRAYDPFQVIDMRNEHRVEQARAALNANPRTDDPIGIYNRARAAPIPLGKTLMVAGNNYDFVVKEVEAI
ncbi:hypothetical protein [uncultured Roseobacter sp.]|uniref:hypothetical protein n=1 Tax=uncultured Roseobacter sp. TaxID=114847 RepID=UPI0026225757|nr:hypothetical protein [uncultured Roseobacter sp.]